MQNQTTHLPVVVVGVLALGGCRHLRWAGCRLRCQHRVEENAFDAVTSALRECQLTPRCSAAAMMGKLVAKCLQTVTS
jgi:hypothetical protein